MVNDPPAIAVHGAAQRFGGRWVFRGVDVTVRRGEVFAVLGASGSGKSTLLRQMVGLQPPTEGRVEVLEQDMYGGSDQAREAVLRRIGVMFQSGALFGDMTLLENVALPLEMFTALPRAGRDAVARSKLGLVGLADAAALRPAEVSGGMTRRAAIARALALDPPLLFLDEPSAGLDPVTSAGIDRLILELRDALGATFLLVTHELASVFAVADRCLMLGGTPATVIAQGDPRALRDRTDNPDVRAFFRRDAA
jgi:phospholipid/cholesterol/gamma-HCH transport system ATP-binding protein